LADIFLTQLAIKNVLVSTSHNVCFCTTWGKQTKHNTC